MVTGPARPHPPRQWTADWGPARCQPAPPPAPGSPPAPALPARCPSGLEPGSSGALGRGMALGVPGRQEPGAHPQAGSRSLQEAAHSQGSWELKLYSGSWQGGGGAAPQTWCGPQWPSAAGEWREREMGRCERSGQERRMETV